MKHVAILKSKIFWMLTVLCIVSLSFLYIFQTNLEISERYIIKDYTSRISELSRENNILEVNSTHFASLDKVVQAAGSLDFEKTDKIHYIKILSSHAVAR